MAEIRSINGNGIYANDVIITDDSLSGSGGVLEQIGLRKSLNLIDENDPNMWHQGWYGETTPRIWAVESIPFACTPNSTLITGCIEFPSTSRYYGIRWYKSDMTLIRAQPLTTAGIWYTLAIPADCRYFTVFFTSDDASVLIEKSAIVTGHPKVVAMFMSYRENSSTYDESQFIPHMSSMAEDVDDGLAVLGEGLLINRIYGKKLTHNRFYGHGNPLQIMQNDSAKAYMVEPIRISADTNYYYRHLYAYFCHLVYDDGTVETFSNVASGDVSGNIVSDGDGWAILTISDASISDGVTEKPFFGENKRACHMGIWEPRADANVYYCEKDNELADFDNLVEAINALATVKDATLYVGAGTWDLVADWDSYDSAYLANFPSDGSKRGLELGNRLRVVFSGNATVECDCSEKSDNVKTYFSPLNTGYGGFTIENMTMNAKSVRYCIHDERRATGLEQYVNRFIGCKFHLDNSENTPWPHVQVIGGGLGTNGYITIESCKFEAVGADNRALVTYHNNSDVNNVGARGRILFKDNYIAGRNRFIFNWYGNSDLVSQAICTGNSWGLEPASSAETPSSTHQNVEIIAWNNELRS